MLILVAFASLLTSLAAEQSFSTNPLWVLDSSAMQCLQKAGYAKFVGNAWKDNGNYDAAGMDNMEKGNKAGIRSLDSTFFMCTDDTKCTYWGNQMEATINRLRTNGISIGTMWISAVYPQNWYANQTKNRDALVSLVERAQTNNQAIGIYAHPASYGQIFGEDYSFASSLPLWWVYYNNHADLYTDFVPFNGWTRPAMHAFNYTANMCGKATVIESSFY